MINFVWQGDVKILIVRINRRDVDGQINVKELQRVIRLLWLSQLGSDLFVCVGHLLLYRSNQKKHGS